MDKFIGQLNSPCFGLVANSLLNTQQNILLSLGVMISSTFVVWRCDVHLPSARSPHYFHCDLRPGDSPTGLRILSWTLIAKMSVFPALTVSPKPPPPKGCFIHVPFQLLLVASFVPGCENRLLIVSCCLWDRNTS